MKIIPFSEEHLEQAVALLTARYRDERAQFPMLPELDLRAAITAERERKLASGVVAVEDDRVIAYMIGHENIGEVYGRSGWVKLAGYAGEASMFRPMYAVLADDWVKHGCLNHAIEAPAGNAAILHTWYSMGFGQEQAYALRSLDTLDERDYEPLEIKLAAHDHDDLIRQLANGVANHQMQTPVFAPSPPEYLAEVRDGYVEVIDEVDEYVFWLGFVDGQPVAHQIYQFGLTPDLITPEQSVYLASAATLPDYRGRGITRQMTDYGLRHFREKGYQYCTNNWRTTNLQSSAVWPTLGWETVMYRLARRIDPNILWAKP